jgi:hypothetical protein
MRRPKNRVIGYFYYFTSFILCGLGLLIYHPFVSWVVAASFLIFIFYAIATSRLPFISPDKNLILKNHHLIPHAVSLLWGVQALSYLLWLVFGALWFGHFPQYGNLKPIFSSHLSLSILLSAFILATEINAISYLMKRSQQPASVLLFFPNQKMNLRIAIYGNIWWRRATVFTSFAFLLFSATLLLPVININSVILFFTTAFMVYFIKSPIFYSWLPKILKHWKISFVNLLLAVITTTVLFYCLLTWFSQPFLADYSFKFGHYFTDTPLIVFWGFAICLTVPLAFLLPSKLMALSPSSILLLILTNPLLWLIIILDFTGLLLPLLQHIPHAALVALAMIMLVSSYLWLAHPMFTALNKNFFMNDAEKQPGPMPRILVQSNLPLALLILLALSIKFPTFFQIDLMATGAYVLIAYGVSTGILLFKLRRRVERH